MTHRQRLYVCSEKFGSNPCRLVRTRGRRAYVMNKGKEVTVTSSVRRAIASRTVLSSAPATPRKKAPRKNKKKK